MLMLLIFIVQFSMASQAYAAEPVKIGVLAFRPKPQTLEQWQPLAAALKQALPEHDFEVQALNFPELESATANKQLDFVLTNPAHYILLTKRHGLSAPIATLATNENGQRATKFGGVIFTRVERSDINSLADIKNKSIAATDVDSFGGYKMQAYELSKAGVNLKDSKLVATGMPHDNVVSAVLNGRAEIGFVRTGVIEGMVREGKLDLKKLKLLNLQKTENFPVSTSTPLYPEWAFAYLPGVDENLARHVVATLLGIEENATATRAMKIHGFVVPADYTPVAEMLKELRVKPFDVTPSFNLEDVWVQYKYSLIGALLAVSFIGLLAIRLTIAKRRLDLEHKVTLSQQKRLHESESHLRTIVKNEPECIKIVDAKGVLLEMNPAGLAMLEANSFEQLAGQPVQNVIAPEYRTAFTKMHKRVIAGEAAQMEFEVIGLKGGRRWLETHAVPLEENGSVVHLAVTRDITQRKIAEAVIKSNAAYSRSLIEASLDPLVTISAEGKITDVNTATENVTGVDRTVLIGSDFANYFTDTEEARKGYQKVFSQGSVTDYPLAIRHISGKVTDVLYNASVYKDSDGKVLGVFAAARDITERKKAEEVTQAASRYSRSLIEASLDPLVTISAEGKITDVNLATEKVTGADRISLIGSDFADYFTEPESARKGYQQVFSQGSVTDYPLAIRHISGKVTDVLYNASVYKDPEGKVIGVFAAARDVTERKAAEMKLRMLSTAIEQSPASVVITDLNAIIEYVNPRFTKVTGFTLEEAVGQNPRVLQSGLTDKSVHVALWDKLTQGKSWVGEFINKRKNGEAYYEEAYISPVKENDGTVSHYVAVKVDISARKKLEEEVRQLAFYDPLTKLPNRRLLNDRLGQALAASRRGNVYSALMFLDLDNFKPLNDKYGHELGDMLLIEAANRLTGCVREMDTVARLGGDEFVVMLGELSEDEEASTAQAAIVAEKIRANLSEPYRFNITHKTQPNASVEHHCTASIGVVIFMGRESNQDDVIKWADAAMYEAKNSGRNQIRFYEGLQHV